MIRRLLNRVRDVLDFDFLLMDDSLYYEDEFDYSKILKTRLREGDLVCIESPYRNLPEYGILLHMDLDSTLYPINNVNVSWMVLHPSGLRVYHEACLRKLEEK